MPLEPTDEMINATENIEILTGHGDDAVFIDIFEAVKIYKAMLESAPEVSGRAVAVEPDYFTHEDDTESWVECPDDCEILEYVNKKVGEEYVVYASHTYKQTYRITKLPDDDDDDTEVELVSSEATLYTAPQPDRTAQLEADKARLLEALRKAAETTYSDKLHADWIALIADMEASK